jgi:hypothetical protein
VGGRIVRRATSFAALGCLLALTLTACGPERFQGPEISVRNDSGRAIVVQYLRSKWEVGAAETRHLGAISIYAFTDGASFTILDAATCEAVDTISLTFKDVADPLIIVPATGAIESRDLTVAERQAQGLMPIESASPEVCLGPADGWNLSVVNRSGRAYFLAMIEPDLGGVVPPGRVVFDVSPHATGTVIWGSFVGAPVAGPIDLLDATTCALVASVVHPAWGHFVVTIGATGDMTIEPGRLPTDGVALPGSRSGPTGSGCIPARSPSASPP